MKRCQFVWWGWEWRAGFKRLDIRESYVALVYRWTLCLGPLEVRRWTTPAERAALNRQINDPSWTDQ